MIITWKCTKGHCGVWVNRGQTIYATTVLHKGLVNKYGGGGGSLNFEPSERGGSLNFELTKRGWVIIFMIQFNNFYKNQTGEQHCANCSCITSLFLLRVSCD